MVWLLLACDDGGDRGDPTGPEPTHPGDRVAVVVEGGEGSGSFPVGSTTHVWATVDPQRAIVTGWHGDTGALTSPQEWNGSLQVPPGGAIVGPDLLEVEAPLVERAYALDAGDRTVLVSAVVEPAGVVMFFHGASYGVGQIRENAPHSLLLHLVHAGFTVVVVPSEAEVRSGVGGWDPAAGSADQRNVAALWAALAADGTLPPGASRVALGMSSGGMFAHAVGATLSLDAVVAFCAPGTGADMARTTAATAWHLAARDGTFPDAVGQATTFQATLAGRGVRTDLVVHPPTPVSDHRFARVAGVTPERSAALVARLRDDGLVDGDGLLIGTGAEVSREVVGWTMFGDDPTALRTAVGAELEILGADHELYDDTAARVVAFLSAAG